MPEYKIVLPKRKVRIIAAWQKRVLAYVIDLMFFFFVILSPFLTLFYSIAGIPIETVNIDEIYENTQLFTIFSVSEYAAYFLLFFYLVGAEYLFGFTIGKKLMNLNVVSNDFSKPSMFNIIIRNLTKSLFLTLLLFDFVPLMIDVRRRRVSDYIAKTLVVENKKFIKRFKVTESI